MRKPLLLLAAATATSGCYTVETPSASGVGSFQVDVTRVSVLAADGRTLQTPEVVRPCIERYGTTTAHVPPEVRGSGDCRYLIPRGPVELELDISALDKTGQPYDFTGPVAFRVVPGNVSGDYTLRWAQLTHGRGTGKVRATNIYGEVRVWALDEPVALDYADGKVAGDMSQLPTEPPTRSYAGGSSGPLFFEEPTLASIQQPHVFDNRSSPFVGRFVTIGRAPESGSVLFQNCRSGDPNHGRPMSLLVTGVESTGFYVTDLTSCRIPEETGGDSGVRAPEPEGFLPGTFGSIFVFNFSYPEGLHRGDLLWTLAGSIQEFTSTTQLTFPSWAVRERVRELPPDQWDKYLKLRPPVELNLRHCGLDDTFAPYITDSLCGHNRRNMKMESLESTLVKVRRVRFPQLFRSCDFDGNGSVPFFCESRLDNGAWVWGGCIFPPPAVDTEAAERQCNIECTIGTGPYANTVCTERTSFNGFGQFVVEMTGPGPREGGLDDSLPRRTQVVPLSHTASARTTQGYDPGTQVSIWCEADVHLRLGGNSVTASSEDPLLPARTRQDVTLGANESSMAFLATTAPEDPLRPPRCHVASNTRTRIMMTTRDAVPELNLDCDENDNDAERAQQCRFLRAATFDVVGHLRHVQPGRPRWMLLPRDANDLCCYPGPGMSCPRPIEPCPSHDD